MQFTTLILFLLGFTLTSSTPTPPANETLVTVPIDFFPGITKGINTTSTATNSTFVARNKNLIECCGGELQGWQGADIGHTTDNIASLKTKGACWVSPRTCVRISCQWKSSIWLCNNRDDIIAPACQYLASYAEDIMGTCSSRGFYAACGIEWDSDEYFVLIAEGGC